MSVLFSFFITWIVWCKAKRFGLQFGSRGRTWFLYFSWTNHLLNAQWLDLLIHKDSERLHYVFSRCLRCQYFVIVGSFTIWFGNFIIRSDVWEFYRVGIMVRGRFFSRTMAICWSHFVFGIWVPFGGFSKFDIHTL